MIYLSWNLAKNVRVSEPKLFEAVKHTLMRSLRQVVLTAEFLKWKGLGKQLHHFATYGLKFKKKWEKILYVGTRFFCHSSIGIV
jgi:hypothetical protein